METLHNDVTQALQVNGIVADVRFELVDAVGAPRVPTLLITRANHPEFKIVVHEESPASFWIQFSDELVTAPLQEVTLPAVDLVRAVVAVALGRYRVRRGLLRRSRGRVVLLANDGREIAWLELSRAV